MPPALPADCICGQLWTYTSSLYVVRDIPFTGAAKVPDAQTTNMVTRLVMKCIIDFLHEGFVSFEFMGVSKVKCVMLY